ncbi:hypothetical protein J6590_099299, partial [Homalodisca vitripennis]
MSGNAPIQVERYKKSQLVEAMETAPAILIYTSSDLDRISIRKEIISDIVLDRLILRNRN